MIRGTRRARPSPRSSNRFPEPDLHLHGFVVKSWRDIQVIVSEQIRPQESLGGDAVR
eukprot:CAMPEP_0180542174 /NCGR_PEP_ID=MMETSP1036_2-20121128/68326_1 /TAXON_ID=632150 /ORGANISM="Azadinium spinosum, Strain 3D9" /LENGTH=56 /DNA_ID=CAMNT_0022557053 /DNA_START=561 /DNA_END=728 /DNA_ORIENTATION=+